jgi:hypothetical protein
LRAILSAARLAESTIASSEFETMKYIDIDSERHIANDVECEKQCRQPVGATRQTIARRSIARIERRREKNASQSQLQRAKTPIFAQKMKVNRFEILRKIIEKCSK